MTMKGMMVSKQTGCEKDRSVLAEKRLRSALATEARSDLNTPLVGISRGAESSQWHHDSGGMMMPVKPSSVVLLRLLFFLLY